MTIRAAAYSAISIYFIRKLIRKIAPSPGGEDTVLFYIPYPRTPIALARVKLPCDPNRLKLFMSLLNKSCGGLWIEMAYPGETRYRKERDFVRLVNISSKTDTTFLHAYRNRILKSLAKCKNAPGIPRFEVA